MWLIVGLGNPGLGYKGTRHNIGFLVVDELASREGMHFRKKKLKALYATGALGEEEVTLIKPQTFMNCSGLAVASWLGTLGLPPSGMILIHDDLDLIPFRIRVRKGGGHGGHRGVFSVIRELGSRDFIRIRIGIGRPTEGHASADYVLEPFSPKERQHLGQTVEKGADAVSLVLDQGLEPAMNRFNTRTGGKDQDPFALGEGENTETLRGEVRNI